MGKVRDRVIGPGRAELATPVRSAPVVMALVLGQDRGSNDSIIRTFQPIDRLQPPAMGLAEERSGCAGRLLPGCSRTPQVPWGKDFHDFS
jgi:hypothetical protein